MDEVKTEVLAVISSQSLTCLTHFHNNQATQTSDVVSPRNVIISSANIFSEVELLEAEFSLYLVKL